MCRRSYDFADRQEMIAAAMRRTLKGSTVMSTKQSLWSWLAAALLLAASGCAAAYHAYPCGCVPYGYCPDPPLPYTAYCGCATHGTCSFAREPAPDPRQSAERSQDRPAAPANLQ